MGRTCPAASTAQIHAHLCPALHLSPAGRVSHQLHQKGTVQRRVAIEVVVRWGQKDSPVG